MHRTTRPDAKADALSAVALLASDGRHHPDMTGSARTAGRSAVSRWTSPGRRAAAALVIPAAFAGLLLAASPASAAPDTATTTTTKGICNGVVNQLAHRGTVQENLLKAAAKKNADLIASLTAQRTALQTQRHGPAGPDRPDQPAARRPRRGRHPARRGPQDRPGQPGLGHGAAGHRCRPGLRRREGAGRPSGAAERRSVRARPAPGPARRGAGDSPRTWASRQTTSRARSTRRTPTSPRRTAS